MSESETQEVVSRHETDDRLLKGLRGATFCVDLTAQGAIFYAEPNDVRAVLNCIQQQHHLTTDTLFGGGISSDYNPRFPPQGFDQETHSSEPLVHLLNTIICVAKETLRQPAEVASCKGSPQCYLSSLRFHSHGIEVIGQYVDPLKPHGIGILGELPAGGKIFWEDVEVIVEVNSQTDVLVQQAATRARFSLLHNRRRFFAISVGFNYRTLDVYFFVFHRSGLSSSRPLSLKTQQGFQDIATHIIGMVSIRDEAEYCLDVTRSQNTFCLNKRYYDVVRVLHIRDDLCGSSTAIYSLNAHTSAPALGLQSQELALSNGINSLPDQVTYKVSYPVEGRTQEGPLFSKFVGQFGIADVVGYHICGPDEPHGSTRRLFRGAEFWGVLGGDGREPEERSQHCIAQSSGGRDLLDLRDKREGIPSPCELLETLLHAIIGHCGIFFGGVLHRDISSGNIIRNPQPVNRPALQMFECTQNVDLCQGFLIDGDHAIEWRTATQSRMYERAGTLPFLSIPLVLAWLGPQPIIPTATDDLESFLWVFLWAITDILEGVEGAVQINPAIPFMKEVLNSKDLEKNLRKAVFAEYLWVQHDVVFGGLIQTWMEIFRPAGDCVRSYTHRVAETPAGSSDREEACNELESFCKGIYEAVLTSGYRHLEGIRQYSCWKDVVEASMSSLVSGR